MNGLSPFVYWAQNESNLFLKVDLKDTEVPRIILENNKLSFLTKGVGAQGLKEYQFSIDFHSEVDKNTKNVKITDHKIDIVLFKSKKEWWPRLTIQPVKPAWLKIDFDKWQSEDEAIEEETRDIRQDFPNLYEQLQKEELGYRKEDIKKVYLTFYNLFMYIGFMYITIVLCIKFVRDGEDFFPHVYDSVGPFMCFMQLIQCLEILHPLFGYVKGGMLMPCLQIQGRLFVLLANLDQERRIQVMPVTFYLFLTWCAIEVIRYPYYMSQLYQKQNKVLTWLRYTAWIILYPVGFSCEAVVLFRNLIFVEDSGKWSMSLPNALNFTFHYSVFLRIYLLFAMMPGMYALMMHMYKIRKQKLGTRSDKIKRS
ncbi:very-long-chain (3R)-3-hydroxyacyl-CoA dehydratase [Diorhabda sublineata]|uniref:very-long-chain (3R)-3-hydroxyacyl-CoA dehydratase n=1 Tax=Diorhabda sublineata TaxID=1163346 RepID=UPI0024E0C9CD|nr:very-long-chain (3R)-3-hydroxyacyl-CoA dehydratase [Diorhabda sublineata]